MEADDIELRNSATFGIANFCSAAENHQLLMREGVLPSLVALAGSSDAEAQVGLYDLIFLNLSVLYTPTIDQLINAYVYIYMYVCIFTLFPFFSLLVIFFLIRHAFLLATITYLPLCLKYSLLVSVFLYVCLTVKLIPFKVTSGSRDSWVSDRCSDP